MELLDRNNLDILNHIAQTIPSVQNPAELFQKCKRLLKILIPCDVLFYFVYEPEQDLFTAPYALNDKESAISPQDAIFYDILNSRHAKVRNESETTVYDGVQCELFVPIFDHFRIFGCLYFGRKKNTYFSYADIRLAEHVAILFRLPVDKLQNAYLQENWGEKAEYWQKSYHALLDAVPYPAAVIGDDIKVNQAFLDFTGYNREEFDLKSFDRIWPDADIVEGKRADSLNTRLTHANHNPINTRVIIRPLTAQKCGYLAVFATPQKAAFSLPAEILRLKLYGEDEKDDFAVLFSLLIKHLQARYITFIDFDQNKRFYAYTSGGIADDEEIDSLSKGPFEAVVKKQKTVYIENVHQSTFFLPWLKAALKANYRSLVMMPIYSEKKRLGLINIYWQNPQKWTDTEKEELDLVQNYITMLILSEKRSACADEFYAKMNCLMQIQKKINQTSDLDQIAQITAEELMQVVKFDYFSMSLINPKDQSSTCYDFAHKGIHRYYPDSVTWKKIPDASLGKVQSLKQSSERLPFSLPSKTSILLMQEETYLGNLALGRVDDTPFSKSQVRFLKHLALILSMAVEKSRGKTAPPEKKTPKPQTLDEEFIFSVIHDLKSPLQSLKSFHTLLYERTESSFCDEEKYYYERIVANLDNIENIINDILVLFRLGHETEEGTECNLNDIVDKILESLAGSLEEQKIRVNKKPLPVIRYSRSGITHIFQNLVSNAIKALSGEPEPTIVIDCEESADEIKIKVQDNGVGIDEEELKLIFRPFYTKSIDGMPSGSGFGLTITSKILDLYGGEIDVVSQPGKGTMFILSFSKDILVL